MAVQRKHTNSLSSSRIGLDKPQSYLWLIEKDYSMNRSIIIFAVLIASFLLNSCASMPNPPDKINSVAALEEYMNKAVASGNPPGMPLAVIKNDSIIYEKGFGWADAPRKIHASPSTVYHWWSCTKIATAMDILQLQEPGKLSLNDPVARHLSFFKVRYPSDDSKRITIQHLLTHISGLSDPSKFTLMRWIHHEGQPPINQTDLIKKTSGLFQVKIRTR